MLNGGAGIFPLPLGMQAQNSVLPGTQMVRPLVIHTGGTLYCLISLLETGMRCARCTRCLHGSQVVVFTVCVRACACGGDGVCVGGGGGGVNACFGLVQWSVWS